MNSRTRKITLSAVLTALALILSLLEKWIPLPFPGIKLGFSNIVTLYALYTLGLPYAAAVLLLRCILASIFSGSITGLLYSLSGGIFSLAVMTLSKRSSVFSIYGVGVLGAAAHSIGQIVAVSLVMSSRSIFLYLPIMLIISILTGLLISTVTCGILKKIPNPWSVFAS